MNTITESTIFTSYLLTPSPLPTLLPYPSFLQLVPKRHRTKPEHHTTLKRIYRDLQFQRSITIDQVRENIARECGPGSAGLKTDLARRIMFEEGQVDEDEIISDERRSRKRRKVVVTDDDGNDDDDTSSSDDNGDDMSNALLLQEVQRTVEDDLRDLHPAARVLPVPVPVLSSNDNRVSRARARRRFEEKFHSKRSLLAAMKSTAEDLERENEEIEQEIARVWGHVKETVGGLSDLRYGRMGGRKAGVDDLGVEEKAMQALQHLSSVLSDKQRRELATTA